MRKEMIKTKAYLTVEAALVMPVVLGVVVLVVYLLFFQYDRCLLEQNTGILALRACTMQITDGEERMRQLIEQSKQADERYLAWYLDEAVMEIKGNRIRVDRSGMLQCPFRGLFGLGGKEWQSRVFYENYRIRPVDFIRNCRKLLAGGK